jgi:hypothetical protein
MRGLAPILTFLLGMFSCGCASTQEIPVTDNGETVVLLHGLGRTSRSMRSLGRRLEARGYTVHNLDYPSRRQSFEELTNYVGRSIEECGGAGAERLHLVGHSLGGILARAYVQEFRPGNLGRVVMLSPPNHGSEIVDVLRRWPFFDRVVGPTGIELGTVPESVPNRLEPPDYEVGIIAGNRSLTVLGSLLLPGPDDGIITVESARLPGARDFLVLPHGHTFIMASVRVAAEVATFLESGRFSREGTSRPTD